MALKRAAQPVGGMLRSLLAAKHVYLINGADMCPTCPDGVHVPADGCGQLDQTGEHSLAGCRCVCCGERVAAVTCRALRRRDPTRGATN